VPGTRHRPTSLLKLCFSHPKPEYVRLRVDFSAFRGQETSKPGQTAVSRAVLARFEGVLRRVSAEFEAVNLNSAALDPPKQVFMCFMFHLWCWGPREGRGESQKSATPSTRRSMISGLSVPLSRVSLSLAQSKRRNSWGTHYWAPRGVSESKTQHIQRRERPTTAIKAGYAMTGPGSEGSGSRRCALWLPEPGVNTSRCPVVCTPRVSALGLGQRQTYTA
jgi:hypothetical protein